MENLDELREKYLATKGIVCPYCGSKELNADPIDADGELGTANVRCSSCGKEWTDEYKMTLSWVTFEDENEEG